MSSSKSEAAEKEYDEQILGIIKEISDDRNCFTIQEITTAAETVLNCTDWTEGYDQYDGIKAIEQFSIGDIVEASFFHEDNELVKLKNSSSAWIYEDIHKFSVQREEGILKISDQRYQFDPVSLLVVQDQNLIDLLSVNERDELCAQGIGSRVYSLTVTRGHGYVKFKNYDQFVGGMVEVGYGIIRSVSNDMLLTVPEGSYRMVMEHGNLYAEKEIRVENGEELTVDLAAYQVQAAKTGKVYFSITPEGAQLNINGVPAVYNDAVELNYGKNIIQVIQEGYDSYIGTLHVKKPYQVVKINLAKDGSEAEIVSSGESVQGSNSSSGGSTNTQQGEDTEQEDSSNSSQENNDEESDNLEDNSQKNDSQSDNSQEDDNKDDTKKDTNKNNSSASDNKNNNKGNSNNQDNNKNNSNKNSNTDKKSDKEESGDTTIKPAESSDVEVDSSHTITVNSPQDVKVYVNDKYVGKSPVAFEKIIGTFTIALSKKGYKTESYTLTMEDDGENTYVSFPELIQSNE